MQPNVRRNDSQYGNRITQFIDRQHVHAPQCGGSRASRTRSSRPANTPERQPSGQGFNAPIEIRRLRTRELKIAILLLEGELALVATGKLVIEDAHQREMEAQLQLIRAEKTRRDLRDLGQGKVIAGHSFFSIGARIQAQAL